MKIGVIPARLNSTRLPKKILEDINGKPMVIRTAEQVSKCKSLDKLIIAIDDEETLNALEKFDFEIVMTSKDHESGTDRVAEVIEQLELEEDEDEVELVVNIQADEPFIKPFLIDELVDAFKDNEVEMATLVSTKIDILDESEKDVCDLLNTDIVKSVLDDDMFIIDFQRKMLSAHMLGLHDVVDPIYKHLGIYAFKKNTLLKFVSLEQTDREKKRKLEQLRALDNGIKIKAVVTGEDSFSINSKKDLEILENGQA